MDAGLASRMHPDRLGLLTLKSKYGTLKPEFTQPLQPTSASFADMIVPSASIAFVAVLETLISAKIAKDRIDRGFSEAGEMRGLTIAHIVCGLTGAMPPTGVFVRTSLNTNLGATHRTSQVINTVIVAIISLIWMPLFFLIPAAGDDRRNSRGRLSPHDSVSIFEAPLG